MVLFYLKPFIVVHGNLFDRQKSETAFNDIQLFLGTCGYAVLSNEARVGDLLQDNKGWG